MCAAKSAVVATVDPSWGEPSSFHVAEGPCRVSAASGGSSAGWRSDRLRYRRAAGPARPSQFRVLGLHTFPPRPGAAHTRTERAGLRHDRSVMLVQLAAALRYRLRTQSGNASQPRTATTPTH